VWLPPKAVLVLEVDRERGLPAEGARAESGQKEKEHRAGWPRAVGGDGEPGGVETKAGMVPSVPQQQKGSGSAKKVHDFPGVRGSKSVGETVADRAHPQEAVVEEEDRLRPRLEVGLEKG